MHYDILRSVRNSKAPWKGHEALTEYSGTWLNLCQVTDAADNTDTTDSVCAVFIITYHCESSAVYLMDVKQPHSVCGP